MARVSQSPAAPPLGSARWVQRLTEEASPVATVGATLSGAGGTGRKGGTLNCWGVPGGGRKWGLCWVPRRLLNPLAQNLATWEENVYFFSPSQHHYFGFCSFLFLFFFLSHHLYPPCSSNCVLQAALALCWDGGEPTKGTGPSCLARPPLVCLPLCPGLVCEVGMTIVATFQPTSQGCCGDTVI